MNKIAFFAFLLISLAGTLHVSLAQEKKFSNPILAGFYPDPSICKVGADYYLINSSFAYFPGIPIFHSTDLVHWQQIGHVLDRPEQLKLAGHGVSRGLFAPAISYHDGIYYVVCTLIDNGGNFVVTATDPAGPWSNPTWLPKVNGIDPSVFFDEDDKAYIIYNSDAPDNKPLYSGHRTIRMFEFYHQNLKVAGENKILVNGGSDITQKPVWIEGPHIYKKDGYYYLMAAEGGTAIEHSEVIFRSKNVDGPYVPYKENPILTQRHLDPARLNPVTTTGHADLVEGVEGEWWVVFLACRPYEKDYYNTGRETFLAPVEWKEDWPVINPNYEEVQYYYPYPFQNTEMKSQAPYSGNFVFEDDFSGSELGMNWIFLRTPHEKWYDLDKGKLMLRLRPETVAGKANPSFLGHRQQHLKGSAAIKLEFAPKAANEKAGILAFQNENHYYFLCKSIENNQPVVQLFKSTETYDSLELLASQTLSGKKTELFLKIEARGDSYAFFFATQPEKWNLLKEDLPAEYLRADVPRDFTGVIYGLYATSSGKSSDTKAVFDEFRYVGDDDIYK